MTADGGGKLTDLIQKSSDKDCHDNGVCSTPGIALLMQEFYHNKTGKTANKNTVLDLLKTELGVKGESCILKNKEFREFAASKHKLDEVDEYLKLAIKPVGPRDSNDWLNNHQIDKTFKLMEKKFPEFRRIPFQMVDFSSVKQNEETLSDVDFIAEYKKGKKLFGCAINTDVSSGNGIHWFAMFVNLKTKPYTIEFFDSTGRRMDYRVREWAMKLQADLNKAGIPTTIVENRREHQRENSECGVYTSFYIYARVHGYSFKDFQTEKIPDKEMEKFRLGMFSEC